MKLWDYLNKEHGLILVDSEINDILELARQEIELPEVEEFQEVSELYQEFEGCPIYGDCVKDGLARAFRNGCSTALNKVRNPYPQTVKFTKDPDDFYGDI
jgi:hypothetical protein